jgi:hypothetical protein
MMVEEKIIMVRGVNYIVSSDGKIYSTNTGGPSYYHKEISQRLNADGYLQITVGKTGNRSQYRVHRMVAEAFIPNSENLPEVNHKDYDRTNNNVDNSEWCTHNDNIVYSAGTGHYSHFGEDNPNYGNDALRKKYAADPELSKAKNSRPGVKNGRCRKIKLINIESDEEMNFDYTRQAAQYLMDNGFVRANKIDSVSNRITLSIEKNTVFYQKFKAEFID